MRSRMLGVVMLASIASTVWLACGEFSSLPDEPGPDAGSDVIAEAAPPGEGGSVGEVGIAPCDANEAPPATSLYVSAQTGADAGAAGGSALTPFKSIADAVKLAPASGATRIIIDEGTYNESVDLQAFPNGIQIDGSWKRTGAKWQRDCAPDRRALTLIQSPIDVGVRIKGAAQASGPIILSNLTVASRGAGSTPQGADGASRYGVFVESGSVRLENVNIFPAPGDPGGGADPGVAGGALCSTSMECDTNPKNGTPGPVGLPPKTYGTLEPTGFVPAAGALGQAGGDGTHGTPGGGLNRMFNCETGCQAQQACVSTPGEVQSQPGSCGCGGRGGGPGAAGRGGGASIGIYVVTGAVFVKYSEVRAESGGAGSKGGAGGAAGAGTKGAKGADAVCWQPKCCTNGQPCPGANCGCYGKGNWNAVCADPNAPTSTIVSGGFPGGDGKSGGEGGIGGGGAGGPSFAYVSLNAANVVAFEESKRVYGAGGTGAGGAPNAPSGERN